MNGSTNVRGGGNYFEIPNFKMSTTKCHIDKMSYDKRPMSKMSPDKIVNLKMSSDKMPHRQNVI